MQDFQFIIQVIGSILSCDRNLKTLSAPFTPFQWRVAVSLTAKNKAPLRHFPRIANWQSQKQTPCNATVASWTMLTLFPFPRQLHNPSVSTKPISLFACNVDEAERNVNKKHNKNKREKKLNWDSNWNWLTPRCTANEAAERAGKLLYKVTLEN